MKLKVGYILAYKDPGYIRSRTILRSLAEIEDVQVYTAINSSRGVLRYAQTLVKLIYIRIRHRPDVFILGFRGQEIFWPVRVITLGTCLIFDEFIIMYDWYTSEHAKLKNSLLKKLLFNYNRSILQASDIVLEDTKAGADFSSQLFNIERSKYHALYVGTDEAMFRPPEISKKNSDKVEVLFYGTMLPLHGIDLILAAAEQLKTQPINFTIIGGRGQPKLIAAIKNQIERRQLNNVTYYAWVEFSKLPQYMMAADLCLGGPFGNTSQSKRVITGKTFQFLAMAKAVVVGDLAEAGFHDKVNALVVERGSATSLAKAINWAYKNKARLTKIGRGGRQLFEQRYSQKVLSQTLARLLSD